MSRRLTRRERASGRGKGTSPSGYTTAADVARGAEQKAAEERRRAESAERARLKWPPRSAHPSTRQLMSAISLLAVTGGRP